MAQVFRLEPSGPWGDHGRVLAHGLSAHRARVDGRIQLERVGPGIAPLTMPGIGDVVVTDALRARLLAERIPGLSFAAVDKVHVARVPWETWSSPPSGEPEDSVLTAPHDPATAEELGPLWELVLPARGQSAARGGVPGVRGTKTFHLDLGDAEPLPLFRATNSRSVFVSASFHARFEDALRACVAAPVTLGAAPPEETRVPRFLHGEEPVPDGYYVKRRLPNPFDGKEMRELAPKPWWRIW